MKSFNQVILLGNLTRDPLVKETTGGQLMATFGLATNHEWIDGQGQKQSQTEFHEVVVWGSRARFVADFVKKGAPVHVVGRLKTRSWEDESGKKIYRTEVVAENIVLLPRGAHGDEMPHETFHAGPSDLPVSPADHF